MAQNSKIEWTDHTANLWWGCTKVHEGCDNCYAEALDKRWTKDGQQTHWGNDANRRAIQSVWKDLARYQKLAEATGAMHRVFVGSMMDIFEKEMPCVDIKGQVIEYLFGPNGKRPATTGDLRNTLFDDISMGRYPNLLFLFLTKRPSNINKYIPEIWKINPPDNVMFGTSPVNQKTAETLITHLKQVNGKKFHHAQDAFR